MNYQNVQDTKEKQTNSLLVASLLGVQHLNKLKTHQAFLNHMKELLGQRAKEKAATLNDHRLVGSVKITEQRCRVIVAYILMRRRKQGTQNRHDMQDTKEKQTYSLLSACLLGVQFLKKTKGNQTSLNHIKGITLGIRSKIEATSLVDYRLVNTVKIIEQRCRVIVAYILMRRRKQGTLNHHNMLDTKKKQTNRLLFACLLGVRRLKKIKIHKAF